MSTALFSMSKRPCGLLVAARAAYPGAENDARRALALRPKQIFQPGSGAFAAQWENLTLRYTIVCFQRLAIMLGAKLAPLRVLIGAHPNLMAAKAARFAS